MEINELENLTTETVRRIQAAADPAALEALRIQTIGRNGLLPKLMAGLKDAADKRAMGQALNRFKTSVTEALASRKAELEAGALTMTV